MIDVFDKIKELLVFESEDDFYYLQILQRRKDNPDVGSNSRIIKNYYIGNIAYLEDRYEEIKSLCDQFNARAMLRLNKRSYAKVAFKTMQNIANSLSNDQYSFIRKSYDRACGNGHNSKNKTWIIDIDGEFFKDEWVLEIIDFINGCRPGGDKLIMQLPTKNGVHLITKPFDLHDFKRMYSEIDVHKDNPINLYIPQVDISCVPRRAVASINLTDFKDGWKFVAGTAEIEIVKKVTNPLSQCTKEWLIENYNENYTHKHSGACPIEKIINCFGLVIWDSSNEINKPNPNSL